MDNALESKVEKDLILKWIKEIGHEQHLTIPLLQQVQSHYGYLPRPALDIIIENSEISGRQLYGVATFYSQFRMKPVGRNIIKVCHGTACHVRGADRLNTALRTTLDLGQEQDTTKTGAYTMEDVACIGCCSLAPVMMINEEVYGELIGTSTKKHLKAHAKRTNETI